MVFNFCLQFVFAALGKIHPSAVGNAANAGKHIGTLFGFGADSSSEEEDEPQYAAGLDNDFDNGDGSDGDSDDRSVDDSDGSSYDGAEGEAPVQAGFRRRTSIVDI